MDTTTPSETGQPDSAMSEAGRLIGIFWEPRPVYEDLAARPRWWVPLIIITLIAMVSWFCVSQFIGWDTIMEREMANNPRLQQLSPEQQQRVLIQQLPLIKWFALVAGVFRGAVTLLVIAGLLLAAFRVSGATDLTFKQSFSICTYSWLPMCIYFLVSLAVMYFVHPADYDLQNPVPLNLGWLVNPADSPAWVYSLLSKLNLFTFWVMALMALGYSVAIRKMRYGKAFTAIFVVWALYVLIAVGWAAVRG